MQSSHCLSRLQAVEHLKTITVGKELAHMIGIAMSKSRRPQACAIVIECTGTIHHLIASVTIQVCHVERVIALSCIGTIRLAVLVVSSRSAAVEMPHVGQRPIGISPSFHDGASIHASAQEHLHRLPIERSSTQAQRIGKFPVVFLITRVPCPIVLIPIGSPLGRCLSLWSTSYEIGTR